MPSYKLGLSADPDLSVSLSHTTSHLSPATRLSSSLDDIHMHNHDDNDNDDQTSVKVDLYRSPSKSIYNDVFTHAATAHAAAAATAFSTPKTQTRWTITPRLPSVQRVQSYHPTLLDFNFHQIQEQGQEQEELIQLPITPPRKAPAPPVYAPRRQRARHIKMKPPAKSGLFTLEEEDEQLQAFAGLGKRRSSSSVASTSGVSLAPSTTSVSSGTSGSGSGSEEEPETPYNELMDPFALPTDVEMAMEMDIEVRTPIHPTISGYTPCSSYYTYTYDYPSPLALSTSKTMPMPMPTLAASLSTSSFKPRRPPPLNLSVITVPHFHLITEQNRTPTLPHHRSGSKSGRSRRREKEELMPSLPILSPEEYSATSSSSSSRGMGMGMDLDEVFDELLMSAGETEVEMLFPLPPPRSPRSSSSRSQQARSSRPRQESPSTPMTPDLATPTTPPAMGRSLYQPGPPGPPGAPGPKRSKPRQPPTSSSSSSSNSYSPYGDRQTAGERGSPIGLGLGLGMGFGGDHSFLLSLSRESSPITTSPSLSFNIGKRASQTSARCISSPLPTSSSSSCSSSFSASSSLSSNTNTSASTNANATPSSRSGATSRGSSTKSKKLPARNGLPSHWTDNVI